MCTLKSSPAAPYWIPAAVQWFSDRHSAWSCVSCSEYMPRNTSSVLTGSFYHVAHRLIRHKDIVNSWWRTKWWWVIRSLFSACISGNKLGSAHHSCLTSLFTIRCCTVFFTFRRFSIWSLYLVLFFYLSYIERKPWTLILSTQEDFMPNTYWNIRC